VPNRVRIPLPLREFTNNEEFVEVNAHTVDDAIKELRARFPGFTKHLLDETGEIRRFVSFHVNEEDIRFLQNRETQLKDGDLITVCPGLVDMRTAATAIDIANRLRMGQKI
jgi:molybdopterin synthase sulfur carrier subunit